MQKQAVSLGRMKSLPRMFKQDKLGKEENIHTERLYSAVLHSTEIDILGADLLLLNRSKSKWILSVCGGFHFSSKLAVREKECVHMYAYEAYTNERTHPILLNWQMEILPSTDLFLSWEVLPPHWHTASTNMQIQAILSFHSWLYSMVQINPCLGGGGGMAASFTSFLPTCTTLKATVPQSKLIWALGHFCLQISVIAFKGWGGQRHMSYFQNQSLAFSWSLQRKPIGWIISVSQNN